MAGKWFPSSGPELTGDTAGNREQGSHRLRAGRPLRLLEVWKPEYSGGN